MTSIERTRGAGFSDWQRKLKEIGKYDVAAFVETMDPGNTPEGDNAHTVIAEQLEMLGLPVQTYVNVPLGDFLANPEHILATIPDGEYYFASIIPGVHLAHGDTVDEVVEFARNYANDTSPRQLDQPIYISHNGEAVMSGHIIIKDDAEPNTIISEFTVGNFNEFHRGFRTPEISANRHEHELEWTFREDLTPTNDWRDDTQYTCQGGVTMTRPEMARRCYEAIQYVPHDGEYYLPGYYEVLFEHTTDNETKPVFIEANLRQL